MASFPAVLQSSSQQMWSRTVSRSDAPHRAGNQAQLGWGGHTEVSDRQGGKSQPSLHPMRLYNPSHGAKKSLQRKFILERGSEFVLFPEVTI